MNYKQKLGYMVLGAAMTLVGMAVSVFSPSLNAQRHSEYIVCKGLTVVDNKGNDAIRLTVGERSESISSSMIRPAKRRLAYTRMGQAMA